VGHGTDQRRRAQRRGVRAEVWVAEQLEQLGWELVAANWRSPAGEIDLVVRQGQQLRFVEVKARAPGDAGGLEAVGAYKQRRLARAAESFLLGYERSFGEACFMVALVCLDPRGWQLELIDDAFDAP